MEKSKTVEKQKYYFWNTLAFCFFSRDLYEDVGTRWKGTGYGFLFLILAILSIPSVVGLQWGISTALPEFAKKIPDFKIEKGIFFSSVQQPYSLVGEKGGVFIDTTGKINSPDQVPGHENLEYLILVTRTKLTTYRSRLGVVEEKTADLSKFPSFSVDQEKLQSWTRSIIRWSGAVCYPFLLVFWFCFEVIVLLFYALLGMLFSLVTAKGLDYVVVLRLSVISHVPVLILSALLGLGNLHLPGQWFCFFALSAGYLYFAVSSQKAADSTALEAL